MGVFQRGPDEDFGAATSSPPPNTATTMMHLSCAVLLIASVFTLQGVLSFTSPTTSSRSLASLKMSSTWADLQTTASNTKVGGALDQSLKEIANGTGRPFVQNKLRLFGSNERPKLTLYRDHAGERVVRRSYLDIDWIIRAATLTFNYSLQDGAHIARKQCYSLKKSRSPSM
jgi:hypothetical protein